VGPRSSGADRCEVDARQRDAAAEIAQLNGGSVPDLVIRVHGPGRGLVGDACVAGAGAARGAGVVFFRRMSGGGTALSVDYATDAHYDNLTLIAPFHYRPRDVRRAYELAGGACAECAVAIVNARRRLTDLAKCSRCWSAAWC